MGPYIEFPYNLIIGQPGGHHSPHNRVGSHTGYPYISSAAKPVLAGIFRPNRVVHSLAAEGGINHNRTPSKSFFNQFKEYS